MIESCDHEPIITDINVVCVFSFVSVTSMISGFVMKRVPVLSSFLLLSKTNFSRTLFEVFRF